MYVYVVYAYLATISFSFTQLRSQRSQRSCGRPSFNRQEVRPFYTMPDPTDEKWTNAYDVGRLGTPWDALGPAEDHGMMLFHEIQ